MKYTVSLISALALGLFCTVGVANTVKQTAKTAVENCQNAMVTLVTGTTQEWLNPAHPQQKPNNSSRKIKAYTDCADDAFIDAKAKEKLASCNNNAPKCAAKHAAATDAWNTVIATISKLPTVQQVQENLTAARQETYGARQEANKHMSPSTGNICAKDPFSSNIRGACIIGSLEVGSPTTGNSCGQGSHQVDGKWVKWTDTSCLNSAGQVAASGIGKSGAANADVAIAGYKDATAQFQIAIDYKE